MNIIDIILISIGVASDAFAVSICKGLSMKEYKLKSCLIVSMYFSLFQAIMPLLGYLTGNLFTKIIIDIGHIIAFILLSIIGFNMIKETKNNEQLNDDIHFKTMIPLAIATSIDAFSVGITFAFLKVNLILSITLIGLITLIITFIGTKIGNTFGDKYEKISKIIGGIILILLGMKILLEHVLLNY